jgi:hypothetical protein
MIVPINEDSEAGYAGGASSFSKALRLRFPNCTRRPPQPARSQGVDVAICAVNADSGGRFADFVHLGAGVVREPSGTAGLATADITGIAAAAVTAATVTERVVGTEAAVAGILTKDSFGIGSDEKRGSSQGENEECEDAHGAFPP